VLQSTFTSTTPNGSDPLHIVVVAIVMDSIPIVGNITCSHGGRCDLRCRSDRDWVVLEIDTSWGGWAGPRSALVPRCDPLEMALAPRRPSSSSRAGGHPSTRVPDDVPYLLLLHLFIFPSQRLGLHLHRHRSLARASST
jgi:hypothetical protein